VTPNNALEDRERPWRAVSLRVGIVAGRSTRSLDVMRVPIIPVVAMAVAAVLSGCQIEVPPLVSGDASISEPGRGVRTWKLSEGNLTQLKAWLTAHKDGWSPDFVTPTAQVYVNLTAADESTMQLWLRGNSLLIMGAKRQQLRQSFSAEDVAKLAVAVGVQQ
jgi:hypothetical protein